MEIGTLADFDYQAIWRWETKLDCTGRGIHIDLKAYDDVLLMNDKTLIFALE